MVHLRPVGSTSIVMDSLNERRFTRVARSFTLPQNVDEQNVDASLDGGVLTLKLSKQEQAKAKKIEVK